MIIGWRNRFVDVCGLCECAATFQQNALGTDDWVYVWFYADCNKSKILKV